MTVSRACSCRLIRLALAIEQCYHRVHCGIADDLDFQGMGRHMRVPDLRNPVWLAGTGKECGNVFCD